MSCGNPGPSHCKLQKDRADCNGGPPQRGVQQRGEFEELRHPDGRELCGLRCQRP